MLFKGSPFVHALSGSSLRSMKVIHLTCMTMLGAMTWMKIVMITRLMVRGTETFDLTFRFRVRTVDVYSRH